MLDSLRDSAPLRLIRAHRRIAAACLIGVAALLALSSLPTRVVQAPAPPLPSPGTDEVIVPLTLSDPAAAAALTTGDVITLVLTDESGFAQEVATDARVRSVDAGSMGSSRSGAISVIVPRSQALRVSAAPVRGTLSVLIQPAR